MSSTLQGLPQGIPMSGYALFQQHIKAMHKTTMLEDQQRQRQEQMEVDLCRRSASPCGPSKSPNVEWDGRWMNQFWLGANRKFVLTSNSYTLQGFCRVRLRSLTDGRKTGKGLFFTGKAGVAEQKVKVCRELCTQSLSSSEPLKSRQNKKTTL